MTSETAITLSVDARETPRMRFSESMILREHGENFLSWKTLVPGIMQSMNFSWEVISGQLKPDDPDQKKKENYEIGNRNARTIFFNIIHPNLFVSLFYTDSSVVLAIDIWKRIQDRFHNETGLYREQAINSWLAFSFSSSKTIEENVQMYKNLTFNLIESKAGVPANVLCSRLVTTLPKSWDPFKMTWSCREENQKTLTTLIELIRSEAARRQTEEGVEEVTALMAKTKFRRKPFNKRFNHKQRRSTNIKQSEKRHQTFTKTTEVVCWTCGKRGHKSAVCRNKKEAPKKTHENNAKSPKVNFSQVFVTINEVPSLGSSTSGCVQAVCDSGSTHHVCNSEEFFLDLLPLRTSREVRLGNSETLQAQGSGTVSLTVLQGKRRMELILHNVLYVPKMNTNLISVSQLLEDGYKVSITKTRMAISAGHSKILAKKNQGLYLLNLEVSDKEAVTLQVESNNQDKVSLFECHKALAHLGKKRVEEFLRRNEIPYNDDMDICKACQQGKQHRQPSRTKPKSARATEPGEIYADTCTATENSLGGYKHFLVLTDSYSKYRKVYFLKSKSEVPDCI